MALDRLATVRRALKGSFEPAPAAVARGRAFLARRDAWLAGPVRFYPAHIGLETLAPAILAAMFDSALKTLERPRVYVLRSDEINATITLTADAGDWRWMVLDATAEGRGLIQLWAWRFCIPVDEAAAEVWALVAQHRASMARTAA